MSFLSKLYFGYFADFRSEWFGRSPELCPPEVALEAFKAEGIHLHSFCVESKRLRIVLEAGESVAPVFATQRLKGRISHAMSRVYPAFPGFMTHFFLRSLGQNTKDIVSAYIQTQVDHSDLVDPLYRKRMKELRFLEEEELTAHKTRHRGVYDLFAHLVLVTGGRYRMFSKEAEKVFLALCDGTRKLGADPLDVSMMPDHAHLLVRWPEKMTAAELLEAVKSESGRLLRRSAFWNNGGYVGTVGPYALRLALARNQREGGWSSGALGSIPRSR